MPIYYNPDATDEEISECFGDYYGCEVCVNKGKCLAMICKELQAAIEKMEV